MSRADEIRYRQEILRDCLEHPGVIRRLYELAVEGVEALVRWQHPERGLLPPDNFLSVAEETGQLIPMTRWLLRETCRNAAQWAGMGFPLRIAVNISARHFAAETLVRLVTQDVRPTRAGQRPHLGEERRDAVADEQGPGGGAEQRAGDADGAGRGRQEDERTRDPALPVLVDETADERPRPSEDEQADRRHGAGQAVGAPPRADHDDDRDAEHRSPDPGEEGADDERPDPGGRQQPAVGGEHGPHCPDALGPAGSRPTGQPTWVPTIAPIA